MVWTVLCVSRGLVLPASTHSRHLPVFAASAALCQLLAVSPRLCPPPGRVPLAVSPAVSPATSPWLSCFLGRAMEETGLRCRRADPLAGRWCLVAALSSPCQSDVLIVFVCPVRGLERAPRVCEQVVRLIWVWRLQPGGS